MGGFEIPTDDGNKVLSYEGVKWLGEKDTELVQVPRSRIMDGSKADTIQTALALLQVGWMAMQCVTRKIYGLPLCLLELHTMVHVVCAVIMYAFWMEVCMSVPRIHLTRFSFGLLWFHESMTLTSFQKPLDLRTPVVIDDLDGDLSAELMLESARLVGVDKFETVPLIYPWRGNISGFRISWLISDPGRFIQFFLAQRPLLVLTITLPVVYGGIHLSAWNFEFPTAAEATTWKVSCFVIALAISCYFLVSVALLIVSETDQRIINFDGVFRFFTQFFVIILFFLLVICRMFIVAESFIRLRSIPIGVYWTPSWIQMILHI